MRDLGRRHLAQLVGVDVHVGVLFLDLAAVDWWISLTLVIILVVISPLYKDNTKPMDDILCQYKY